MYRLPPLIAKCSVGPIYCDIWAENYGPGVGVDGGADAVLLEEDVALLLQQLRLPLRRRRAVHRRRHLRRPSLRYGKERGDGWEARRLRDLFLKIS